MSQKFQVGNTVQLKTGGPLMKVEGYDPQDAKMVQCVWSIRDRNFPETHHEDKLRLQDSDQIKVSTI